MSELKVNVISEVTGANGVVVDSVKLKDGGIVIADAGNIGSTSDVDAIAIGSDGDITLTQDLELQHDGAILSFGANDEVSLTHVHDTGLLLNSTNVIQFNDASQNIGAPSATVLDINATDEIELNATLVDVNANLDVSGTITSGGVITGTAFTAGSAVLAEAELELLDGLTAGTAIASKVVTTDASIDTTGQRNLTITGELDAATLDISGAIDIAGNSQFSGTITVGVDDTGKYVKFFGATSGAYMQWDESVDDLLLGGAARIVSPIGIFGIDNNAGGTVSIASGDSGATANSSAAELVVENNGTAGISILTFNNTTGNIYFGDGQDDDIGQMVYDHSTNDMALTAGGSERLRLEGTGPLSTGGETAGDVHVGGICLDSNAADGNYITLKSSDYGHGVTDWAETDTGFVMSKSQAGGGVAMLAVNDGQNENIFSFTSIMGEANTTATNTSSGGNFLMSVYRKADSGTGTQAVADAGNAWVMRNNNAARLIFKGDGEIHSDTGSTTYDAYEDAQLVRAFDLSHGVGVINSKFDKFISYNHEKLADLGLVGRDEDGTPNHFTNITGMQKLHNGAIWQQYEKHNRLLEAVYELASESVGKEKADAILEKHEIKLLN